MFGSEVPNVPAAPGVKPLEAEMFARVNADRRRAGLPALRYDERLADVGRAHSADMLRSGFFDHESPTTGKLDDRMDRAGYLALEMRENLASAIDVQRGEDNLLASPGHHANIMARSVTHIGIGIVRGMGPQEPRGLTMTQVFAMPVQRQPPAEAERQVAAKLAERRRAKGLPALRVSRLLVSLAARHLPQLTGEARSDEVEEIAGEVRAALERESGHGLGSVQVVAQAFFTASEFSVGEGAFDPAVMTMGLAAAVGRDARGRPRVKVLLLLGRQRARAR